MRKNARFFCYSSCFLVNPARCVSGSTLLHTASFFGAIPVIKVLSVTEWLPTQMLSQLRLSALSTKKNMFRYFFTKLKKIDHLSYSFYKHDAIEIANPSSMQDVCHV